MKSDLTAGNQSGDLTAVVQADRWMPESGVLPVSCTVPTEIDLTVVANGRKVVTLRATPDSLEELTIGYLYTSGYIQSASQVTRWRCDPANWRVEVTLDPALDPVSGVCRSAAAGGNTGQKSFGNDPVRPDGPPASIISPDARTILAAGEWIAGCSRIFLESGGVHAAGLFDPMQGPLFFFEDVARHNAVDKVIGKGLAEALEMSRLMLVRTGRTSAEIVLKAGRAAIPVMVARGAPTLQAIMLARDTGITMVGFARQSEFTIYTHPERISK